MRPYLKLLEEAATDDDTVSIKITLYRLSAYFPRLFDCYALPPKMEKRSLRL